MCIPILLLQRSIVCMCRHHPCLWWRRACHPWAEWCRSDRSSPIARGRRRIAQKCLQERALEPRRRVYELLRGQPKQRGAGVLLGPVPHGHVPRTRSCGNLLTFRAADVHRHTRAEGAGMPTPSGLRTFQRLRLCGHCAAVLGNRVSMWARAGWGALQSHRLNARERPPRRCSPRASPLATAARLVQGRA